MYIIVQRFLLFLSLFQIACSVSRDPDFDFTLARVGYDVLPYFDTDSGDYVSYKILKKFNAVIEPNSQMKLALWLNDDDDEMKREAFTFTICDILNKCYAGVGSFDAQKATAVVIDCNPFDEFDFTVIGYNDKMEKVSQQEGKAICLYVRREISSLSNSDLEKAMDAMATLWSVSDEDGQELYGENYHSASYFSAAHDFNAAQQDADHFHEGLGFIPQHIKLTNMFEASVQSVDKSVALPYWDFTIDVAQNKTIFDSNMFTDVTFGTLTKPKDSYWGFTWANDNLAETSIQTGRWAGAKAELNTRFPDLSNGFGFMRGPWNMNPSPYITRFSAYSPSLPSCSNYYGGIGGPDDFIDSLTTAPYGPHASTHGVIGAVFGCDKLDSFRESGIIKDEDSQLSICKKWGFYMKELYRANYITSRDDCTASSMEYDDIDCGFVCNEDQYDDLLSDLKTTIGSNYLKTSMSTEDWESFRDFICTGDGWRIFVADHLESASPIDPSFWPIHPTQERLLHAKFMIGCYADGSYTWPTDYINEYVCDKSKCYESEYGTKDNYDTCCYGHFEYDQMLDFTKGDTKTYFGPTNHQVLHDTNPRNKDYAMTYIYENIQWSHCEEDFDFELNKVYESNLYKFVDDDDDDDDDDGGTVVSDVTTMGSVSVWVVLASLLIPLLVGLTIGALVYMCHAFADKTHPSNYSMKHVPISKLDTNSNFKSNKFRSWFPNEGYNTFDSAPGYDEEGGAIDMDEVIDERSLLLAREMDEKMAAVTALERELEATRVHVALLEKQLVENKSSPKTPKASPSGQQAKTVGNIKDLIARFEGSQSPSPSTPGGSFSSSKGASSSSFSERLPSLVPETSLSSAAAITAVDGDVGIEGGIVLEGENISAKIVSTAEAISQEHTP